MNFRPLRTEEADQKKKDFAVGNLLPKGWYDFEVMESQDAVSKKSGNEMIKLKLKVFGPNGVEKHVYDYLIETAELHLFDFCEAVGLAAEYANGTLTADMCEGRCAKVEIRIDDKDKNYEPKNVAKNYGKEAPVKGPKPQDQVDDSDEIPF